MSDTLNKTVLLMALDLLKNKRTTAVKTSHGFVVIAPSHYMWCYTCEYSLGN